jgi:hypothetical protein
MPAQPVPEVTLIFTTDEKHLPGNQRPGIGALPLSYARHLRTATAAGFEPATSRLTVEVTHVFTTGKSSFLSLRSNRHADISTTSPSCACDRRLRRASRPCRYVGVFGKAANAGNKVPNGEQSTRV